MRFLMKVSMPVEAGNAAAKKRIRRDPEHPRAAKARGCLLHRGRRPANGPLRDSHERSVRDSSSCRTLVPRLERQHRSDAGHGAGGPHEGRAGRRGSSQDLRLANGRPNRSPCPARSHSRMLPPARDTPRDHKQYQARPYQNAGLRTQVRDGLVAPEYLRETVDGPRVKSQ